MGAAVKWVIDESTLARVGEVTTVFVKPAFDAGEVIKSDRVGDGNERPQIKNCFERSLLIILE